MNPFICVLVFFESMLHTAVGHIENEHRSIRRSHSYVTAAVAKSSSCPIAANVELIVSAKRKMALITRRVVLSSFLGSILKVDVVLWQYVFGTAKT